MFFVGWGFGVWCAVGFDEFGIGTELGVDHDLVDLAPAPAPVPTQK